MTANSYPKQQSGSTPKKRELPRALVGNVKKIEIRRKKQSHIKNEVKKSREAK